MSVPDALAARSHLILTGDGGPVDRYQHWVDRSLLPTPQRAVTVHFRSTAAIHILCQSGGAVACAAPSGIWVDDDPYAKPTLGARAGFLHEVGHIVDLDYDVSHRIRFAAALGLANTASAVQGWFGTKAYAETWAVAFEEMAVSRRRPAWLAGAEGQPSEGYGFFPTRRQYRQIFALMRDLPADELKAEGDYSDTPFALSWADLDPIDREALLGSGPAERSWLAVTQSVTPDQVLTSSSNPISQWTP